MASYALDDPRPIAAKAPYTFWLPSEEELAALAPGDLVKLIFRPVPGGRKWDAERMWVIIERMNGDGLEGRLDNEPEDIPGLKLDDPVQFQRHHVIDRRWAEERAATPPAPAASREYRERCFVDRCVLDEGVAVHFIYREQPDPLREGDRYPDSGWRIHGDERGLTDAEIDARKASYVALGSVLNVDDSWLPLIDAPVGSAFIRDWESGGFVPDRTSD